jgi:hypothetical protein
MHTIDIWETGGLPVIILNLSDELQALAALSPGKKHPVLIE